MKRPILKKALRVAAFVAVGLPSAALLGGVGLSVAGGVKAVRSIKTIHKDITYYSMITDYHMNMFTNGILMSSRFNNIYPIKDMKFVKDDRKPRSMEEFGGIDEKYIKGLRLEEQADGINNAPTHGNTGSFKGYVDQWINRCGL